MRAVAIGWFGEGNLGDEAMLAGLIALLRRVGGPLALTATTADVVGTEAAHGVKGIMRRTPEESGFRDLALTRATLRADLVTLGGGDLIREQSDGVVPARNSARPHARPFRASATDGAARN